MADHTPQPKGKGEGVKEWHYGKNELGKCNLQPFIDKIYVNHRAITNSWYAI